MAELSIEEKAKAYDEAIEQAEKELTVCRDMNCDAARQIFRLFPQLAESEDERIRKVLVELISTYLREHENGKIHDVYAKNILAWLDKQGEKKPWSEEDEEIRNNCIFWLEKARKYFEKDEDLIYDKKWIVKCTDRLKFLKERMT